MDENTLARANRLNDEIRNLRGFIQAASRLEGKLSATALQELWEDYPRELNKFAGAELSALLKKGLDEAMRRLKLLEAEFGRII